MKKKNSGGLVFIVVILVIIILGMIGYIICDKYMAKNKLNNSTNNGDNIENFDSIVEVNNLNTYLSDVGSSLGFILIVNSFNNYDDGMYSIDKNINLLDDEAKQLFVMEYILKDTDNYDNFTVLNANTLEVDNDEEPTSEGVISYYPYDLYNNIYIKLFDKDFDSSKREFSSSNSTYDKNENYVFYDNRKAGANGLSVLYIVSNNAVKDNDMYQADVVVTYSDRMSTNLGYNTDDAIIKYTKDSNNNIIINSFTLK